MATDNRIIVINLERALDRKEKMIEQLTKASINSEEVIFYPGFDGKNIKNTTLDLKITSGYGKGRKLENGEVGCLLSHIGAVSLAKSLNWEYAIILEDDVIISTDFLDRINYIFKIVPKNWEHIFLGGHIYDFNPICLPSLHVSPKTSGAFAYIIKNTVYDKILNTLYSLTTTSDDLYESMKLKSYIYFPLCAYPLQGHSYIWDEPGQFDIHPSAKYFREKR